MLLGKENKKLVDRRIKELGFDGFIVALGKTLSDVYKDNKDFGGSAHQKKFYRRILKYLLTKTQVGDTILVSNINKIYPSNYAENKLRSVKGFEQFEVVLDTSVKPYKLGIVLDLFPEIYNASDGDGKTQEIRLDTNGVMCDEYVKKVTIDTFLKYFDPTTDYGIKLLNGIFIKPKKEVK